VKRGILIRYPNPGWAKSVHGSLLPGGHVCVFGGFRTALEAEDVGFEVRDCIIVLGLKRETVWLCRKALEEGTVAAQVLKTGTGALWIDGCRVAGTVQVPGSMRSYRRFDDRGDKPELVAPPPPNPCGRWPSNLVLVHGPECRQEGTKRVKGHPGYPNGPGGKSHHYSSSKRSEEVRPNAWEGHPDEDVPAWQCQPGCPVKLLDAQSGDSKSQVWSPRTSQEPGEGWGMTATGSEYNDSGGASRFFPQFGDVSELDLWLMKLMLGPG
jgi:hypothetical protein